jgi:hypothetical protein
MPLRSIAFGTSKTQNHAIYGRDLESLNSGSADSSKDAPAAARGTSHIQHALRARNGAII